MVLYPLAMVELQVAGRKITVEAAVLKTLPTAVLLGMDRRGVRDDKSSSEEGEEGRRRDRNKWECEVHSKPLEGPDSSANTDSLATTEGPDSSATTKGPDSSATTDRPDSSATTKGPDSSAITEGPDSSATTDRLDSSATTEGPHSSATTEGPHSSAAEGPHSSTTTNDIAHAEESWNLFNVFNDVMFLVSRDRRERTRWEKRDARRKYREVSSSLNVTAEELQKLQLQIHHLRRYGLGSGVKFFIRDELIYRRRIPQERDEETEQLVVPVKCRRQLLKLAHTTPFVGHLGRTTTTQRLLQ
uniref:Integrase zinc-binding domain-containing protein n=1 Tax=Amphimedon queenslandica TaxID=400682 RepID=A0A1X7U3J4_AMPQE